MFEQLEMCSDHQETSSFSIREEKKYIHTHTYKYEGGYVKNIK